MPRYLNIMGYSLTAFMAAVFFYGIVFYIDAPFKPCGAQFCGKTGKIHTLAEYQGFKRWEKMLLLTWAIGWPFQAGFWAVKRDRWPAGEKPVAPRDPSTAFQKEP